MSYLLPHLHSGYAVDQAILVRVMAYDCCVAVGWTKPKDVSTDLG